MVKGPESVVTDDEIVRITMACALGRGGVDEDELIQCVQLYEAHKQNAAIWQLVLKGKIAIRLVDGHLRCAYVEAKEGAC